MTVKQIVRKMPIVGPLAQSLWRSIRGAPATFNTSDYWEERYKSGGNSGRGSYDRLAAFKAEYLNDFVKQNEIQSVIEFGSGDGAQLRLAKYPAYIGVDVSQTILQKTRRMFAGKPEYRFVHTSELQPDTQCDLALSLDVIFHLVEDEVFENYMTGLFNAGRRFVIIYSSNEELAPVAQHVRHRKFTNWVQANRPDFALAATVPNKYPFEESDRKNTSRADFFVFRRA